MRFTEPTDRTGKTVSQVTFSRSARATHGWVESPEIRSKYRSQLDRLAESREDRLWVVLTNEAWKVDPSMASGPAPPTFQ